MADNEEQEERHSVALEAEIINDSRKKAEAEARNGLKQYDFGMQVVQQALDRGTFKLRVSVVLALQREALAGISAYAGNFRPAGVEILGSTHKPVEAHLVAERIEEMCDYVNDHWNDATAIHLASYIMWRLNWIHPFSDGNGRTSRILSYVILCIKTGSIFPGTPTIPEQIVENRNPYFAALDAADAAFADGRIDLSVMEDLLSGMLAVQLKNAYERAGGKI
ncbi:Fic family protein [Ochrobactrum vermis]|uniref:Fic family protein n=1 Tax=Ochrobactrum vermis TaxID=1827297 RepID=A0ABU8PFD7_9HYPH|nr:Fic family protein [Ochrobactrum vermis]PQZ30512.1 cell filamentation protein Fic [Ochrobactrum vermis]